LIGRPKKIELQVYDVGGWKRSDYTSGDQVLGNDFPLDFDEKETGKCRRSRKSTPAGSLIEKSEEMTQTRME
jgi:hypothetical protein